MSAELRVFAPDQFILPEDSPDAALHEILTAWMQGGFVFDAKGWIRDRVAVGDVPAFTLVCLDRLDQARANAALLPVSAIAASERLFPLLEALAALPGLPAATVCRLVARERGLMLDAAFELAKRQVAAQGFSPEIVESLRALARRSSKYSGAQQFRKQVDGFLLRAAPPSSRPKRGGCWGDYVRWSIGAGEAAHREAWEALLAMVTVHNVSLPRNGSSRQSRYCGGSAPRKWNRDSVNGSALFTTRRIRAARTG